ncbi:hypothetical protein SAMN02745170_01510 [Propionispora hippei DSM 15287]|uniref:Uncharacterized protein n=1 Tax=Propionispora hippei DSM 15287 TaxID=1123003 RepID=A0A1M6FP22_9FIRM|nr:hypothetical protein SAMN02745170_01510 [Propionispora hippei DSM 15287]
MHVIQVTGSGFVQSFFDTNLQEGRIVGYNGLEVGIIKIIEEEIR